MSRRKKRTKKFSLLFLLIFVMIICGILIYLYYHQEILTPPDPYQESPSDPYQGSSGKMAYLAAPNTNASSVEITFLELFRDGNNPQIGDSLLIECGDVDILIDAGEKGSGSATVVPFLEEHVTDDILELVIVTHADSDHLGGMVGVSSGYGALEIPDFTYQYIIDFGYTASTNVYHDYVSLRDAQIKKGAKYFTPQEIFDEDNLEAYSRFYLAEDAYLDLLDYQTYALNDIKDDNDRSVCCLLSYYQKKVLLCGDAEKEEEKYLTSLNLGHIDVFKANHHGSPTSNTTALLDQITPEYIIISASEKNSYNLPKKTIIKRFLDYTNNVYANFISGNIVVKITKDNINITSQRELIFVQDSVWYLNDDPSNPK